MIRHYEMRYKQDYIAKLREDGATCTEVVFYKGEQIHRAEFPASNLGTAKRGGYLECMAVSVAREHFQMKLDSARELASCFVPVDYPSHPFTPNTGEDEDEDYCSVCGMMVGASLANHI